MEKLFKLLVCPFFIKTRVTGSDRLIYERPEGPDTSPPAPEPEKKDERPDIVPIETAAIRAARAKAEGKPDEVAARAEKLRQFLLEKHVAAAEAVKGAASRLTSVFSAPETADAQKQAAQDTLGSAPPPEEQLAETVKTEEAAEQRKLTPQQAFKIMKEKYLEDKSRGLDVSLEGLIQYLSVNKYLTVIPGQTVTSEQVVAAVIELQKAINAKSKKEGGKIIAVDGIFGVETYRALTERFYKPGEKGGLLAQLKGGAEEPVSIVAKREKERELPPPHLAVYDVTINKEIQDVTGATIPVNTKNVRVYVYPKKFTVVARDLDRFLTFQRNDQQIVQLLPSAYQALLAKEGEPVELARKIRDNLTKELQPVLDGFEEAYARYQAHKADRLQQNVKTQIYADIYESYTKVLTTAAAINLQLEAKSLPAIGGLEVKIHNTDVTLNLSDLKKDIQDYLNKDYLEAAIATMPPEKDRESIDQQILAGLSSYAKAQDVRVAEVVKQAQDFMSASKSTELPSES